MVVAVDRGRWTCAVDGDPGRRVTAMRARELGRTPVVVGDRVGLVGDIGSEPDQLARIVRVEERSSVLRRTADDTDPYERVVVANAEQLLIVASLADPPPRTGLIDRCLVAGYAGGLKPVLCLTKRDLATPDAVLERYAALDLPVLVTSPESGVEEVRARLAGRVSVLVGHSGVGKSTLVNRLVPDAARATGVVSGVGKGRHTSSSVIALPLPQADGLGGWVIDTPGIRSFGLAHVSADDVVRTFGDLAEAITDCPRGCTHLGPPADPECALDQLDGAAHRRALSVRTLLTTFTESGW
ncbi:MAG: ribosome small subunit-dependent GTPase A [Pseudonocardiaceae bacterium]